MQSPTGWTIKAMKPASARRMTMDAEIVPSLLMGGS